MSRGAVSRQTPKVLVVDDDQGVRQALRRGLAVEGFEVPLAAWRLHATAAVLDDKAGNTQSARSHRVASHATILRLANSLPAEEPLRELFVSAPTVAAILNGES